jgi:hypothetical protein
LHRPTDVTFSSVSIIPTFFLLDAPRIGVFPDAGDDSEILGIAAAAADLVAAAAAVPDDVDCEFAGEELGDASDLGDLDLLPRRGLMSTGSALFFDELARFIIPCIPRPPRLPPPPPRPPPILKLPCRLPPVP